jgi:hypothetical protein
MALPASNDPLVAALWKQPRGLLLEAIWNANLDVLAQWCAQQINVDSGRLSVHWPKLDLVAERDLIVAAASLQPAIIAWLLLKRDEIAEVLRKLNLPPSLASLQKRLDQILPMALQDPRVQQELHRRPFAELWPRVADQLCRQTAAEFRKAIGSSGEPEWRILNRQLLAGYFAGCRLPDARTVSQDMQALRQCRLPIRGALTRIVENIAAHGSAADPPPKTIRRSGGVRLAHAKLSVLIAATESESQATATGNGMMHRILGPIGAESIAERGQVSRQQMIRGRDAAWQLYEHTVLAYLALSSIEQLLRSWATHRALQHVKADGTPLSVGRQWFKDLPLSVNLRADILELYDSGGGNIRNRVVHGALLDIEAKRLEAVLPIADPKKYKQRMAAAAPDPWSAHAIAQRCLDVLQRLDREIVKSNGLLTSADCSWMSSVAPTPTHVQRGQEVHCDFLEDVQTAIAWQSRMNDFLGAMFPAVKQCWSAGFHGWSGRFSPTNSVTQFLLLVYTFEPIFRMTAHLLGCPVLQKPEVGTTAAAGAFKIQYRMLEERDKGLCTSEVFDRVFEEIDAVRRPLAKEVVMTAVHLRNAIAHGAILSLTSDELDGLGHIVVKAGQALVSAGHHHMVREAAFFRYKGRRGQHGFALDDWLGAEAQIARLFEDDRQRRQAGASRRPSAQRI